MIMPRKALRGALLGFVSFLSACVAVEKPPLQSQAPNASDKPVIYPATTTLSGSLLAGQAAYERENYAQAAKYYEFARKADPNSPEIALKTLDALIQSGQVADTGPIADQVLSVYPKNVIASFAKAMLSLKAGSYGDTVAYMNNVDSFPAASILKPMVQTWAYAGLADLKAMDNALTALESEPGFTAFAQMHRAMIGSYLDLPTAARDLDLALSAAGEAPASHLVQFAANAYIRSGQTPKAVDLMQAALDRAPDDANLQGYITAVRAGQTTRSEPNPTQGVAVALQQVAIAISRDRANQLSVQLLNWAHFLAPDDYRITQDLMDLLHALERHEEVLKLALKVPPTTPEYWLVAITEAQALNALGRSNEAIQLLSVLDQTREGRTDAISELGILLRQQNRYDEAAVAYTEALARIETISARHWLLYYIRGIAYDRAKKWPLAEKDMLRALELSPDHPQVLNYLGYTWVEQGRNLVDAFDMIEKAVEQRPTDGYIVDSLGWAHYMLGNFEEATKHLERAVELRPDDPVINDHLGDAFWQVGREREAKYQWQRALIFDPEPDLRTEIELKLRQGLTS